MMKKFTPIIAMAMCVAGASLAQDSRLTGFNVIRYDNGWQAYDSARYVYNPGNNMVTSVSPYGHAIKYDTMYRAGHDGSTYIDYARSHKIHNLAGNCLERQDFEIYPNVEPDKRVLFTYDGNNNVLEQLEQTWDGSNWENEYRTTSTYNSNNDLTFQNTEYWNNTTWGSSYITIYTYDVNNDLVRTVSANHNNQTTVYDSTSYSAFFINSGGKADSSHSFIWQSGWTPSNRTFNYYNQNYALTGWMYMNWDGSNWVNGGQGFNTLNGNDMLLKDSIQNWNTTTNQWENNYRDVYVLDGNDNTVERRYEDWSTTANDWAPDYKDSTYYNAHNQPTWYKSFSWDNVNNVWGYEYNDQEWHYYYELYTANKVASINKSAGTLLLYPVPARGSINVNMQWNKAQDFTVGIYDVQGRLVSQWAEKATEKYNKRIPLNGLSSGTYILKVRGKDATVQEQFVIMD